MCLERISRKNFCRHNYLVEHPKHLFKHTHTDTQTHTHKHRRIQTKPKRNNQTKSIKKILNICVKKKHIQNIFKKKFFFYKKTEPPDLFSISRNATIVKAKFVGANTNGNIALYIKIVSPFGFLFFVIFVIFVIFVVFLGCFLFFNFFFCANSHPKKKKKT